MSKTEEKPELSAWVSIAITLILLSSLGFPGSFTNVFGSMFGTLIEYASFLIQIMIMLAGSGKTLMDIKVVDIKPGVYHIYVFLIAIWFVSMIGTSNHTEELVTVIRVSVTAMFAIWLAENLSLEELLEAVYRAQILYIAASIVFPVLFSAYDIRTESYEGDFVGIGGVKNVVAEELSFGIIMQLLLWKVKRDEKKPISPIFPGVLLVQVILLVMSHGTGPLVSTILVAVILFISVKEEQTRINWGAACVIISVVFLFAAFSLLKYMGPLLTLMGEDVTLTGRVPLWEQVIEVMRSSHTFTGYGYGHFWFDDEAVSLMHSGFSSNSFFGKMTSGTHNNLLELWANTGLIGVIAFFGVITVSFSGMKSLDTNRYLFVTGFMTYYILRGLTERAWTNYEYPTLFLFIAMAVAAQRITGNEQH